MNFATKHCKKLRFLFISLALNFFLNIVISDSLFRNFFSARGHSFLRSFAVQYFTIVSGNINVVLVVSDKRRRFGEKEVS